MKNKCLLLLKIQLYKMMGFNRIRYSKDPKDRHKSVAQFILFCFLGLLIFSYSFLLSFGLGIIGMLEEAPVLLMSMASIFVLVTTFIKCNGVLFGFRDYELLYSLPVKPQDIIISRFSSMYSMNLLFTCAVMIPSGIAYFIFAKVDILFIIAFILSLFVIPFIPMILSTILGTIIMFLSRHMKHRNLITTILTLGVCSVIIVLSFSMQSMNSSEVEIEKLSQLIMDQIYQIYPLAPIYKLAVCDTNIIVLLAYIFGSLVVFIAFVWLVSKKYNDIHTAIATYKQKGNYKLGVQSSGSSFMALYKKELKRYISSSVYVTNTFIGDILMVALAVCLLVFKPEQVTQYLNLPVNSNLLKDMMPYGFSLITCMTCSTAASISLEGKHLWILKSLPINNKMIYRSKIAVNLTITVPAIIISAVIVTIALQTNIWQTLLLFVTPIVYAIFSAQFGISMNLLFPNFQWDSEVEVIKQGVSVLLTILGGIISVFIIGFLVFLLGGKNIFLTSMILNIILMSVTYLMYYLSGKKKLQSL